MKLPNDQPLVALNAQPSPQPPGASPENTRMRPFSRPKKKTYSLASLLHGHSSRRYGCVTAGEGSRVGAKGGSLIGGFNGVEATDLGFCDDGEEVMLPSLCPPLLFFHCPTSKLKLPVIALVLYTNFVSATDACCSQIKMVNFSAAVGRR